MNLHKQAEEDVERILARYGTWLSGFRGCLDRGVQEAGGYWEDPNVDFRLMDPCTRSGHVRAYAGGLAVKLPDGEAALRLKIVSFSGLHLFTSDGQRIRTRTRPRNTKTGLPMRVGKSWADSPLWGHDPSAQPYEISVLVDIDMRTKTLAMASLAAIDWGEDDKGREIYYEQEISAPPLAGMGDSGSGGLPVRPNPSGPLDDDFADYLGEGDDSVGSNPA